MSTLFLIILFNCNFDSKKENENTTENTDEEDGLVTNLVSAPYRQRWAEFLFRILQPNLDTQFSVCLSPNSFHRFNFLKNSRNCRGNIFLIFLRVSTIF